MNGLVMRSVRSIFNEPKEATSVRDEFFVFTQRETCEWADRDARADEEKIRGGNYTVGNVY